MLKEPFDTRYANDSEKNPSYISEHYGNINKVAEAYLPSAICVCGRTALCECQ